MSLSPGTRLGPYEITGPIGAGGMGEVYRATDTNLKRTVAIKVLPEAVATDRERLARFQREAEVLARLNHPNIAAIYGLEKSDGTVALVMELVEGPTLADRLARGPLPLDEALAIARQVAEALEAAHEPSIIHRDLKPANIKVREDGTVKVLDFGLAKALDPVGITAGDLANSPTITSPAMTEIGMILGTAAYMSPEQARGKPVDRRADIWAFGAVVFELLTGKRAFPGEDIADTLAAVVRAEPDWNLLPRDLSPTLLVYLRRCLQKDPKQRPQAIGDVRLALEGAFETAAPAAASPAAPPPPRPVWRRAVPVALAAVLASALTFGAAWSLRPLPPPLAVTRFLFPLPEGQTFTNTGRNTVAISPDGARMVYVANSRLYLRPLSDVDAKPISGTEGFPNVINPVFSPDGQSVAFFTTQDNTIKRIAVTGGAAVTISPATIPYGMSWGPDGIAFGQAGRGILRVSPGGTPQVLVKVGEDETAGSPQVLPGGEHVLFTLATGTASDRWEQAQVVVQSLASGERRVIVKRGSDGRYLPTGHVVYALGGSLFAVAFDARRLEERGGSAAPIVEGVRRAGPAGGLLTGAAHFSVSHTGSLVFVPGPAAFVAGMWNVARIDRKGGVEPLNLPAGQYQHPRVSPDDSRLAVVTNDPKGDYISIYDLAGGTGLRRLTFDGNNRYPIWSRDSQRVTFQSDRDGDQAIFWQLANGTGPAERLTRPDKGTGHVPESWSLKDETLLFAAVKQPPVTYSLWTFSRASRKEEPFGDVQTSAVIGAVFSPDGSWVAYSSGEAGRVTVYVQPFPATGAKYQLAAKSGEQPHHQVWSEKGRELVYSTRPSWFEVVPVRTQPTFAFGNPTAVPKSFDSGPLSIPRHFDIMRDGKFLGLVPPGQDASGTPARPEIQVVVNWFEELKRRVPTR